MFALGHVGIGTALVPPSARRRLPWAWVAVGCLLPDLLDKPLFYGVLLGLHRSPDALGVLRGSRLFGHTLLFLALLAALAFVSRASAWVALAVGTATHLLLDFVAEAISGAPAESSIWRALLWPLLGTGFPQSHASAWSAHLRADLDNVVYLVGEAVGALLLALEWRRRRRRLQRS